MRHKITVLCFVLLFSIVALFLFGCDKDAEELYNSEAKDGITANEEYPESGKLEVVGIWDSGHIYVIEDKDTGVQYFYNPRGAVQPRLEVDGSPFIKESAS